MAKGPEEMQSEMFRRREDLKKASEAFFEILERVSGTERDLAVLRRIMERLVKAGYCGLENDMMLALPYAEYLKTHHWQEKRTRAMRSAGFRCMLCNQEGELHTHHRTYENLGRENDSDLICLCGECHEAFHQRMKADHQFAS